MSATLGSVLPGYPAGDGGAKVTVHHLRTPPGGEWHRAWDDPFAQQLRRMGVREQDAVRIEQKLQQRGIPVEVFNERFESRMNTVVPVLTALALLPLVPILRFFDRRRAWAEHFMFILSASNGVWLYSLLLLPLALVSVRFHQILIAFALYVYLGVVFFAHYRAATTLRTTGRFAVFAVADFVVSIVLSTVLFAIVYLSVLLF